MAEKQVDLFLDSIVNAPLKDDRALMEFPFFSLQKAPRHRPLVYDDGKVKIEVRPGDKGIATIWAPSRTRAGKRRPPAGNR